MILKTCILFFLIISIRGSNIDEIKKKIKEYQDALTKLEVQCALDEFYDIMESAAFYQDIHKKCPDLADFEESTDPPEEYDFIVVGGGNSGTLMARRLTEENTFNVLLLEKGAKPSYMSKIPVLSPFMYFTNYTENKCMEPEEEVGWAMKDRRLVLVHGMGLGGSSIMDDMLVSKGHKSNFDTWGNDWCNDAVKYFTKSEKAKLTGKVDSGNHNFDGPQTRSDAYLSPLGDAFVKCGKENGLPEIDDTGDFDTGVCRVKTLTKNGRRENHAEAFLDEILDRPNFFMKEACAVFKILINENMRAYGIQYVYNKKIYTVLAKKDIILSLGQFHTPQLLMLSGIGPKNHLEELGIKCILDLPVGQTMHDVISYIGLMYIVNSTAPACLKDIINKKNVEEFIQNGTGMLASPNSIESVATVKIMSDDPNVKIQMVNRGWSIDEGKALRQTVGISREFYNHYFKHLEGKRVVMVVPIIPAESTGRIRLKCKNPFEDPIVYGSYYSDPKDRKLMIAAIKYTMEYMECEAFKKFNLTFFSKPIPGCEHKHGLDAYLECATKYLTVSYQDQTGTCKMGPASDPTAVVDNDLRIHGINNIVVIGSQVMPRSILGGGNGVSTMMVERVADLIKASHGITPEEYCPN